MDLDRGSDNLVGDLVEGGCRRRISHAIDPCNPHVSPHVAIYGRNRGGSSQRWEVFA